MGRIRTGLGWVFVRGPAAAYALADSGSSLVGILGVLGMLLVAGAGAGIGALVGLAIGTTVGDAAFVGGMAGLGVVIAWLLLSLVVVAVLWVRGVSPGRVATGTEPVGRHAAPVESARSDQVFWLWNAGICGGLGVLTGVGYLAGRLRSTARRAD